MSEQQVKPLWTDERIIAEAEALAASYVTVPDDLRRIMRYEMIGLLRSAVNCEKKARAATMSEQQVWTDNQIIDTYDHAFGRKPDVHHMAMMRTIRDDLQAQLDAALFALMQHNPDALAGDIQQWVKDAAAQLDAAQQRISELEKQLAVYVWEEIDHQEFLSPLVRQDKLRAQYKQLTGRDYDESEGDDD